MSCRLGLRIGESFAELRGLSDSSAFPPIQKRWYLPKKSLGEGLREALQALGAHADSGLLQIVSSPIDHAVTRQQSSIPALLVTSGFESWLKIQQPLSSSSFTLSPSREKTLIPDDQIFGINERLSADGTVLESIKMDELEFLISKLELLKIKRLVICFLHSDLNPEHEDQAARFFRERGFSVTTSHAANAAPRSNAGELARWRWAIECAESEGTAAEERLMIEEALKSALGEARPSWQVRLWTPAGPVDWPVDRNDASPTPLARGGSDHALSELAKKRDSALTLHFGLERFVALANRGGEMRAIALPVQPTRRIEVGPWSVPTFGDEDRGYEPGPMLFGKSHHLSLLDVLYVRDRLEDIEAFTPLVSERTRPRILEALFTLGKTIPTQKNRGTIDAKDVAEDLETFFVDRVAGSIARLGAQGAVHLTGALAPSILPLLKKRRPDLVFAWDPEFAWAGADSCLADQVALTKILGTRRNLK